MDIRIILAGLRRSGKTMFARAASGLISNLFSSSKPQRRDPYYPYIALLHRSGEDLSKELDALETTSRRYYDLLVIDELSKATPLRPISLSSTEEATGLEYGTFVIRDINGRDNLFLVDMHGKDFDVFFHNYILENEGILLSKDRDKIIRTLLNGFIRYIEDIGGSAERIDKELGKIKSYKDLNRFYRRSRKMLRNTYTGESGLSPTEVTIAVFFSSLTGLRNEEVKTSTLVIYGPNSIKESHESLGKIRKFRDVVINTRKILSNAPSLIAISHSKIDLLYKEFIDSSGLEPTSYSARRAFVDRYLSHILSGFDIQSIHASIHDEEISRKLLGPEAYIPISIPYNILPAIYEIYQRATGRTTIPREIYKNVLPYPYAYLYFALSGGIA